MPPQRQVGVDPGLHRRKRSSSKRRISDASPLHPQQVGIRPSPPQPQTCRSDSDARSGLAESEARASSVSRWNSTASTEAGSALSRYPPPNRWMSTPRAERRLDT